MDTKLFFPEHLSGLDDNNEHQIDTLSGTVDFRVIMSTNLNERPTAVPTRRKGVFKRFRQWVGKRSRAIRRIWSRRQRRTESRVEVIGKMIIMLIEYIINHVETFSFERREERTKGRCH